MVEHTKWSDLRPQVVAELGGEQVVVEAHRRQQAYIDARTSTPTGSPSGAARSG